jgi:hypothetical protein
MAKQCFVIGPIGSKGSELRAHSDDLIKFIVQPVLTRRPTRIPEDFRREGFPGDNFLRYCPTRAREAVPIFRMTFPSQTAGEYVERR